LNEVIEVCRPNLLEMTCFNKQAQCLISDARRTLYHHTFKEPLAVARKREAIPSVKRVLALSIVNGKPPVSVKPVLNALLNVWQRGIPEQEWRDSRLCREENFTLPSPDALPCGRNSRCNAGACSQKEHMTTGRINSHGANQSVDSKLDNGFGHDYSFL